MHQQPHSPPVVRTFTTRDAGPTVGAAAGKAKSFDLRICSGSTAQNRVKRGRCERFPDLRILARFGTLVANFEEHRRIAWNI
jgi:hypothetical protein